MPKGPIVQRFVSRGFTLIELMIAVAIVALLVAVALPSYLENAAKSRRAEGRTALLKALQLQERFYTTRTPTVADPIRYGQAADLPALFGLGAGAVVFSGENPALVTGHYILTVAAATAGCPIASCVVVVATPQGNHAPDPRCRVLTLSSTGVRTTTGTQPGFTADQNLAYCWGR